jgi:hypothetical protein
MHRVNFFDVPEMEDLITGPRAVMLWDVLSGMLQGDSEVEFIRSVIGEDRVSMNASTAQELASLLEILSDLRGAAADPAPSSSATEFSSPTRNPPLTSANKELLQERLRQLITSARVAPDEIFKTPREKQIVDIVVRPPSSVGSCRSRSIDSRPTSMGSSSSRSTFVDPSKGLVPIRGSLRFDRIHEVTQHIVDCFATEYTHLVQDIDFVRGLIEVEMHESSQRSVPEPSMLELKSLTKKVEDAEKQREHVEMIQRLPEAKKRGSLAAL